MVECGGQGWVSPSSDRDGGPLESPGDEPENSFEAQRDDFPSEKYVYLPPGDGLGGLGGFSSRCPLFNGQTFRSNKNLKCVTEFK